MIVATNTSAFGAVLVMRSTRVARRAGAPDVSPYMSLVPMCSSTVRGFVARTQLTMLASIWAMVQPEWPSWSWSPRLAGPLDSALAGVVATGTAAVMAATAARAAHRSRARRGLDVGAVVAGGGG